MMEVHLLMLSGDRYADRMLTAQNRRDLEEKGFTVIQGVLTEAEADEYRKQYEDWIRDNFGKGTFPDSWKSLVHR